MADSHYAQYEHALLSANSSQPPQQQHQSRRAVFARLTQPFVGTSRPPSSSGNNSGLTGAGGGSGPTSVTNAPNLTVPRNLRYNLGSAILALSTNDEDRIVVAGREILRVLRVGTNEITEEANLRLPGEQKRHFQYDVKWGTIHQKNIIATAGTNGTICLYDVKQGKLDRMLREHVRQVHRLAFNQANGNLLLSASQDGTIKLWDLRENKSRFTFVGKSDAVRDVQFNAANATEFAAAFDSGAIQRWDYRKESIYERKINAHNGPAFTVDWHPDGRHCASGGRDRTVKIWDFNADPRRKPKHELTTMASVSRIAWRPSRNNKNDTTQLATCAINNDHRMQLWDFKRPYIPSRIMDVHDNATTGILWKDEDILWSCAKDCTLVQTYVPSAPQPIDSLTHSAISWAPDGEFTFAGQRRARSRFHTVGGRADFDEDTLREDRRSHGRSSSFRSSRPSLNALNVFDTTLDKFMPSQSAARVSIPSLFDKEAFVYFAEKYIIDLDGVAGGKKMTLLQACDWNARVAFRAQNHRTATTWKMIQKIIASEDEEAAEKRKFQRAESVSSAQHPTGLVARRALGLGGDNSASASGGATPLAPPSPASAPTPTPAKHESMGEQLLRLPPSAFGRSPSSSTISTDGEEYAVTEKVVPALAPIHPDSDAPNVSPSSSKVRPNLTVDTGASNHTKAHDMGTSAQPGGESKANANGSAHHSIDENHNLPLFTATSERSDPLGVHSPAQKGTAHVDINNPANAKSNGKNDQSTSHPYSATTHTDTSFNGSQSLQRQFSLVSEQTSSSYGVLESTRSDMSDSESPNHANTTHPNISNNSLPPITEEMNASTILSPYSAQQPQSVPQLRMPVPSTQTSVSTADDEKPWSSRHMVEQFLAYSTETGDVQTAAVLILLLHRRMLFSAHIVEEVLDGYLSLLTQMRYFSVAALVRKLAPSEVVRMSGQFNVDVDLSCGECGRAVGGRGGGWCMKCAGRGGAACVICGELGKERRWTVCGVCGHGGCEGCLRGWFVGEDAEREEGMERCPAVGCGCACLPR
ncbi:hypothetical protein BZA05DRAFT_408924 [Tricharina praecox]|uniref:uncharacterized protein n=1 Tax=Tricharina praecox TaxID=43433 RepID=UPI00221F37A9|nr:uncharacterized protein BZA05DRAFT_408924 [Tricharina praecox]KAI5844902.1 hypothetical protein BZA05DRAFT_408924 [Tricharina praecox]